MDLVKKRPDAKPGQLAGHKRKSDAEPSKNPITKEVRERLDAMSPTEKTIEKAKNADRLTVCRAILQLRATAEYQSASKAEQDRVQEACVCIEPHLRLLRDWVDRENIKGHPNKTSPWDVGVILPHHPNATTYAQELRNGPAQDTVNTKNAAIQPAMQKIRNKLYPPTTNRSSPLRSALMPLMMT
ncbi:hypothetical protein CNMCM5623_006234 [Aspergillus felis]|uniref:Uncharacterized protein n=1 Tax=Aspergillus felis TaxID=1287682 RepID=A0A8H6QKP2_9EURO|nr:hypothetical protein CNMCM5623_006234 [Aspergillus felis]